MDPHNSSPASLRRPTEVEIWDDDEDLMIPVEFKAGPPSDVRSRRDSVSSRRSLQSEGRQSFEGFREQEFVIPEGDSAFMIQSARKAGIPVPNDTPASALMGGKIKRLNSSKPKRRTQNDDWSDDIELPTNGVFKLQSPIRRQSVVESGPLSPRSSNGMVSPRGTRFTSLSSSPLDRFREQDEESIGEFSGFRTPASSPPKQRVLMSPVRPSSSRSGTGSSPPKQRMLMSPARPSPPRSTQSRKRSSASLDDFDADFDIPDTGEELKLNLKTKRESMGSPSFGSEDDWFEDGSLGTRFGGTAREVRSSRSSVASMMSPSMTSTFTLESEETNLDDLKLPEGPIDFKSVLEKRKRPPIDDTLVNKDDFFDDIDIGEGEIFDPAKLTLNRNIIAKQTKKESPSKKNTGVSLTFTNKPSRIPRPYLTALPPSGPVLEPVEEATTPNAQQPNHKQLPSSEKQRRHRYSGPPSVDATQFGIFGTQYGSIPPPPPIPGAATQARNRRPLSKNGRPEPTTTSAQLLRMKRSMPNVNSNPSSPQRSRPTSRADSQASSRPRTPSNRPKTPVSRPKTPGSDKGSRVPIPNIPSAYSAKGRRPSGANENESPAARPRSRLSRTISESPQTRSRQSSIATSAAGSRPSSIVAPEFLRREAAATRVMTKPARRRNFGDGTELDTFDDLPTNAKAEQKYTVQPVGRGAPKVMRSRSFASDTAHTPKSSISISTQASSVTTTGGSSLPQFMRDTAASRNAREQRASAAASQASSSHWRMQLALRAEPAKPKDNLKKKQSRPHLIKPMGNAAQVPKGNSDCDSLSYTPETELPNSSEAPTVVETSSAPKESPPSLPLPTQIPVVVDSVLRESTLKSRLSSFFKPNVTKLIAKGEKQLREALGEDNESALLSTSQIPAPALKEGDVPRSPSSPTGLSVTQKVSERLSGPSLRRSASVRNMSQIPVPTGGLTRTTSKSTLRTTSYQDGQRSPVPVPAAQLKFPKFQQQPGSPSKVSGIQKIAEKLGALSFSKSLRKTTSLFTIPMPVSEEEKAQTEKPEASLFSSKLQNVPTLDLLDILSSDDSHSPISSDLHSNAPSDAHTIPSDFSEAPKTPTSSSPKLHEAADTDFLAVPFPELPEIKVTNPSPPAAVKGMRYNPKTFKWEGNDEAVKDFEPIPAPISGTGGLASPPNDGKKRPALILGKSSQNVQVSGGMVFDPSRMCWLKVSATESDNESDPFEGIDDLIVDDGASGKGGALGAGDIGEFVVGEEFDVGPQWEKRQRNEEGEWNKWVNGWVMSTMGIENVDNRREWELRDMILQSAPRDD